MNARANPAALAPQGDNADDAYERRNLALWLVVADEPGPPARRYAVTADDAWVYANDAYDHCASTCETPGDATSCHYETREA